MIIIRSPREIEKLRTCGKLVAEVHEHLKKAIKPGIATRELDRIAEEVIRSRGATPSFKGYRLANKKPFPGNICTSINEEVVHGIPGKRKLKRGDIVSIDVGIEWRGYYGDGAATYAVGEISPEIFRLLKVTQKALVSGIEQAKKGRRLGDISRAIQRTVEEEGFSVVRDFVGHGIGTKMHEEPQVPNFYTGHTGPVLKPGMVLAIEPMVNMGGWKVCTLEDGWTVVTEDGKPSAHFEHMVAITEGEPLILTQA